jgi:hypothetical protein
MSQMGTDACAALSQNMDFDVVVPLEHVSAEDREARDRARRLEYEHEIRANTTLMFALLHVFQVPVLLFLSSSRTMFSLTSFAHVPVNVSCSRTYQPPRRSSIS